MREMQVVKTSITVIRLFTFLKTLTIFLSKFCNFLKA